MRWVHQRPERREEVRRPGGQEGFSRKQASECGEGRLCESIFIENEMEKGKCIPSLLSGFVCRTVVARLAKPCHHRRTSSRCLATGVLAVLSTMMGSVVASYADCDSRTFHASSPGQTRLYVIVVVLCHICTCSLFDRFVVCL